MTARSTRNKTLFFWILVALVVIGAACLALRQYLNQPHLLPEQQAAVPAPAPVPAPPQAEPCPPPQTRKQLLDNPLIEYGSLDLDGNFNVTLSQVTVRPDDGAEKIPIDRVVVKGVDLLHQPPHRLKITLTGVTLTPDTAPGQFGQILRDLDYGQIRADLDLKFKYLEDTREFLLEQFVLDIPEAGTLTLKGLLGHVPWELLGDSENLLVFLMKMPDVTLAALELKFVNQGLVQRFIDRQSRQAGLSREKYLSGLFQEIDRETGYVRTSGGRQIVEVLKSFLQAPGQLEITALADEPLALGDLPAQWDHFKETGRLNLLVVNRPLTGEAG
jgi:hypothetical protein